MTASDRIPESRARAEAYWLLATLIADPPGDRLAAMVELSRQAQGEPAGLAGDILATLASEPDLGVLAERLAVEHTRLFRGVREGYGPPPPYASLWREGQMMGDTTVAALRCYLAAGFQPDDRWGPPDHLAEQFRFVAALANSEAEAWGTGNPEEADWARTQQAEFVRQHLAPWAPEYCRSLEEQAVEPFYKALARVTAAMLAEDVRLLAGA